MIYLFCAISSWINEIVTYVLIRIIYNKLIRRATMHGGNITVYTIGIKVSKNLYAETNDFQLDEPRYASVQWTIKFKSLYVFNYCHV